MFATITISGPGGCINNELSVIRKALTEIGYAVCVDNPHPAEKCSDEEMLEHVRKLECKGEVRIVMQHQPWGG